VKGHGVLSAGALLKRSRQAGPSAAAAVRPFENLQVLEKLHERPGNTNVTDITVAKTDLAASLQAMIGSGRNGPEINPGHEMPKRHSPKDVARESPTG
jgi:hypothetical protein